MYCCFFLSLRSQFIFDFSFQKFDYYTTWCGFLGFFLFGVCSASRICQFMNFTKTVEFSAIIYLSSFTVASSFYSSGHSDELEVRSFVINPQFLQVLFMFFSLFFCLCSDWVIFIVLSSSSLVLSSILFILLLSPSIDLLLFFNLGYCIFSSTVFILILLYIFFFFSETS